MSELIKVSNGDIVFRIRLNYNNIYSRLRMILGPDADFFADIQTFSQQTIWSVSGNLRYMPFTSASPEDRVRIAQELSARQEACRQKLASSGELAPYTNDILNIPDESYIFYCELPSGGMNVVLTGWGCAKPHTAGAANMLERVVHDHRVTLLPLSLQAYWPKRRPAFGVELMFDYLSLHKPVTTGADGRYVIGKMLLGNPFSFTEPRTGTRRDFIVDDSISVYELSFDAFTSATFRVINQYSEPVAGTTVDATFDGQSYPLTTGPDGVASIEELRLTEQTDDTVGVVLPAFDLSRSFPLEVAPNRFDIIVDEQFTASPRVKVVDQHGNPCPEYPLSVNCGGQNLFEGAADHNGMVNLAPVAAGRSITVIDGRNPLNQKVYPIDRSTGEVIFPVDIQQEQPPLPPVPEPEPEEPIKEPQPEPGDITVALFGYDKVTPMPGVTINLTTPNGQATGITDHAGEARYPFSGFVDKKKVRADMSGPGVQVKGHKFRFHKELNYYSIYLVKRRNWWKWLLMLLFALLLPLLLLIKCEKQLPVQTVDSAGNPVAGAMVSLSYTEKYLYDFDKGGFFSQNPYYRVQTTDGEGKTTFTGLKCSVYSYIFNMLHKARFHAEAGTKKGDRSVLFHLWPGRKTVVIPLEAERKDMVFLVRDGQTQARIQMAIISLEYDQASNGPVTDSLFTDQNGIAVWKGMEVPTQVGQLKCYKAGYAMAIENNLSLDHSVDTVIIELGIPERCSAGGTNNSENQGYSLREYDMGQPSGVFPFSYYTDTAPDEIIVYDSPAALRSPSNVIFHINEATGEETRTEKLKFTSRVITVEVFGDTRWIYTVYCP